METTQSPERSIQSQAFVAAVMADLPVPVRSFYGSVASRSSFYRWREGIVTPSGTVKLTTHDIPDMGTAVIPSELRAFLIRIERTDNGKTANS